MNINNLMFKNLLWMEITVGIVGCASAISIALLVPNSRAADAFSIGTLFATGLVELALVQWRLSKFKRIYIVTQDELDERKSAGEGDVGALVVVRSEAQAEPTLQRSTSAMPFTKRIRRWRGGTR